jgi:hypothetical protein
MDLNPQWIHCATQGALRKRSVVRSLAGVRLVGGDKPAAWKNGGPCRNRTYNLLIKSQLLYQLS